MPRQLSLVSCWDVFVCRTCLDHNCSVEEKLEFKRSEDVLEEVEKFCYLGYTISYYCGASKAVRARIGGACKKFRKLSVRLDGKHGLSLKEWGKIEITVVDEAKLCGVESCMIRILRMVRLIDRVLNDVLCDRVGVVKIQNVIIQSRHWWYDHVMHGDINSQICEVMEIEITGKRKKGWPRKLWEEGVLKDLELYGENWMRAIEGNGESTLE